MWRELITNLCPKATYADPAPADELRRAADELHCTLPDELISLLRETNGVEGEYGLGLVWPIGRIIDDNLHFREAFKDLYMPFEPLLFFADAGNGDQFAFPRIPPRSEVFSWNHEDDSRNWAASSLEQYLQSWLEGKIST
jgi:hypothetical protein